MNYTQRTADHITELAGGWVDPKGAVRAVHTFAEAGCDHSRYGMVVTLASKARVWCQVAWSGPVQTARVLGERAPAPPRWSPLSDEGMVTTIWVEEWIAHLAGRALPRAHVARHSRSPTLGGVQELGVRALDGDRQVLLGFPWMLRQGEEPHPRNRYRYRPGL